MVSFNIFRLAADWIHVISYIIILMKIFATKNTHGLSLKAALLHCMVFYCRYSDIFWNTTALYNTVMKLTFLALSTAVAVLIGFAKPYCNSYENNKDTFPAWGLVLAAFVCGLIFHEQLTIFEVMWSFSIWLEAVAVMPQVHMLRAFAKENSGAVENITADYMFALGTYRSFYMMNWIYRYIFEKYYYDPISWVAGTIQTIMYADFIYCYVTAKMYHKNMTLPI